MEPQSAEFHNNLATVLGRMNRPIEALGEAQRALDIKADLPEALGNKGVALEALGRLDEAIDVYRKAVELKADHIDALANLGAALSRKGEHEEAISCLRTFADLRPRSAPARKSLGNVRMTRRSGEKTTRGHGDAERDFTASPNHRVESDASRRAGFSTSRTDDRLV